MKLDIERSQPNPPPIVGGTITLETIEEVKEMFCAMNLVCSSIEGHKDRYRESFVEVVFKLRDQFKNSLERDKLYE